MSVAREHSSSRLYGSTAVRDRSTAILGDVHGNVQIQNIYVIQNTDPDNGNAESFVERHNYIREGYTLERITTYDNGKNKSGRGRSRHTELRWERRECLGSGNYGEVYREQCITEGSDLNRAVKILRFSQLGRQNIDIRKEIGVLTKLSHKQYLDRFVEFYSWFQDKDRVYLSMEYIRFGDLSKHIEEGLPEQEVLQIGHQIIDGLRIMHQLDIVHRDIKPANILVVTRGPEWWVKIGDFSIAKSTLTQLTTLRTNVGTDFYQAPEIAKIVQTTKPNQYDSSCDIWSTGCLLYELMTTTLPFTEIMHLVDYCRGNFSIPEECLRQKASVGFLDFVSLLLQPLPADRPSALDALKLIPRPAAPDCKPRTTWITNENCGPVMYSIPESTSQVDVMSTSTKGKSIPSAQPPDCSKLELTTKNSMETGLQPVDHTDRPLPPLPKLRRRKSRARNTTAIDSMITTASQDRLAQGNGTRRRTHHKRLLFYELPDGSTYTFSCHAYHTWDDAQANIRKIPELTARDTFTLVDPSGIILSRHNWPSSIRHGTTIKVIERGEAEELDDDVSQRYQTPAAQCAPSANIKSEPKKEFKGSVKRRRERSESSSRGVVNYIRRLKSTPELSEADKWSTMGNPSVGGRRVHHFAKYSESVSKDMSDSSSDGGNDPGHEQKLVKERLQSVLQIIRSVTSMLSISR